MKRALIIIIALLLLLMQPLYVLGDGNTDDDVVGGNIDELAGHWAEQEMTQGYIAGWFRPDYGSGFNPDRNMTRAEFVTTLLRAFRVTPKSATAQFLMNASAQVETPYIFEDTKSHWVQKGGWLKTAQAVGIIRPTDYQNGRFEPEREITRGEITIMTARALGLTYPATRYEEKKLNFTDEKSLSPFIKGHVQQLADRNIIDKLPDGSFGADKKVSKAEAAVVMTKAVSRMEGGIDPNIRVTAKLGSAANPKTLKINGRKQVVDNVVYVSARELYKKAEPNGKWVWDPGNQILAIEDGTLYEFQAGNAQYGYLADISEHSKKLQAPSRLLYGELMIAAHRIDAPTSTDLWEAPAWDSSVKTLTIYLKEADSP